MRGSRRTVALVTVMGVLVGMLLTGAAQAQETDTGAAGEKVVFSVGVDSDVTGLNPFNLCCGPDYEYLNLVYDLAIGFDNDTLQAAPKLVEQWSASEDKMDWTMTIVEGATWHDGEPVTAEDLAFTFSFIADNKMPFYKDYFPFSPTFEVVDDRTLIWHSTQPTAAPEIPAYAPVLPQHIWSEFSDADDPKRAAKSFDNDNPIGSGPFKFVEYEKGQFLRLEANEDYWGGTPATIDEIVIRVYENQERMVQALKSGEIDFADGLNTTLWNSLEGEPNIGRHSGDSGCYDNFAWNFGGQGNKATGDPVIHERPFRHAVSHAINREQIVDRVYQGTATVGHSVLMPGSNGSWYRDIPEELRFDYDPERAAQMLDEAGIVDNDGDGTREYEGQNINLELLTITDVRGSVDSGKLIQNYLSAVGISSFFTTVNTNKAYDLWGTGEFDAYVWGWCPDPDPDFMLSVFTTDQCLGWSDGCYSNPEYDELYELQRTQLERADREATVERMQFMLAEEIPMMVLAYVNDLQAFRTDRFDQETYVLSPNNDQGLMLMGWTNDSYMNLNFVDQAQGGGGGGGTAGGTTGLPGWVWVAGIAAIVLIGVVVAMSRRKGEADEA
jgi:peptide/nickel transport system substrate-binding protein